MEMDSVISICDVMKNINQTDTIIKDVNALFFNSM